MELQGTKKSKTHALVAPLVLVGQCWLLFGCSEATPEAGAHAATDGDGTGAGAGAGTGGGETASYTTGGGGDSGGGADPAADDGTSGSSDLPPAVPPDPEAQAKLFSHDYLPVYRITMEGSSWAEAWAYLMSMLDPADKCADRPFTETSVEFENPWTGETESYEQVGFRLRGHDLPEQMVAQPEQRFGFKMSFSTYMDGRRFHGHKLVNFLSSERDDTLMRQCLTYELMRDFDVPAARCNFASVYVNGDYVGVFAHVEERDDGTYTKNRFPDDPSGSMYEFGDCWGDEDDVLTDLGPDPEPYIETYQLEAGTSEADLAANLIPFMQCASLPGPSFTACIEQHIDVGEWHRAMAAHFSIPDMDGWAPSGSNFMLYHYGPNGEPRRFLIFPWDVDRAFKDDCYKNDDDGDNHTGPCHIMGSAWQDGMSPELVNRLRQPPFRSGYCAAVQSFVDQHFNPAAMAVRMNELRTQPRVAAKPFDGLPAPSLEDLIMRDPLWDLARFDNKFDEMVEDFVPDRHAALVEQLLDCDMSPLIVN